MFKKQTPKCSGHCKNALKSYKYYSIYPFTTPFTTPLWNLQTFKIYSLTSLVDCLTHRWSHLVMNVRGFRDLIMSKGWGSFPWGVWHIVGIRRNTYPTQSDLLWLWQTYWHWSAQQKHLSQRVQKTLGGIDAKLKLKCKSASARHRRWVYKPHPI